MSNHATSFAKKRRTGATGRKAALMIAADVCDDYGVMWGGVDYFAGVLECHRDTAISYLQRLEEDGHIERIRRWKTDGSPTTSLIVLAPRDDDRGSLLDPRNHPEYGRLITAHLAKPRSASSGPKSEIPTSGSTPAQVGILPGPSRDSRHNTSTDTPSRDTSAAERASASDEPTDVERAAATYREHVLRPLSTVPQWAPAMTAGADLGILSLIQSAPDAPWDRIAASAAAARLAGDLTTGRPLVALEFKLRDWTRGHSAGGEGRPSWDDVRQDLIAAVGAHKNELDTLAALQSDLRLASLIVAAGWADILLVGRNAADDYDTRQAASRVRKVWASLEPDPAAVQRQLESADRRVSEVVRRAGHESRADIGYRTPPMTEDGR